MGEAFFKVREYILFDLTLLSVAPVAVYGAYCDYILVKDCYHTPDLKHVCGTDGKTYRN